MTDFDVAAALGVPLDFGPLEPRFTVVKEGVVLYVVFVFTSSYAWDHIAGMTWTRWGANRLGRRAVRKAQRSKRA